MALLGNKLQQAYSATAKDTFNGDGSTVAFTLSRPSRTNDVEVFVENVQQEPTVAYAVSGTTLTFTEAPASGTGNIYVIHRTQATQSLTVNTDDIVDGSITSAKLAEGAVTDPTPAVVSGVANTATDFFALPKGTTAQRPVSPDNGYIRYNTTEGHIEEYRGGIWQAVSNVFSASGGTETTANIGGTDYKIHTFTSSGTFTVQSGVATVNYLVVAGGGGGADQHSGGGGGGGLRTGTLSASPGSFTVTIGGGGAGGDGGNNQGTSSTEKGGNGGDSVFASITSIGGGGGGDFINVPGLSGGSGGGGGSDSGAGGAGTSGQGNAGGAGATHNTGGGGGGGGGGAGGAGEDALAGSSGGSGDGGPGLLDNIDGNGYYWAGGGGGGHVQTGSRGTGNGGIGGGGGGGGVAGSTGGLGGGSAINSGADGGKDNGGFAGAFGGAGGTNTGGGGGGSGRWESYGGNGGSGIVIIRYAI